ncbi:MAG: choice-of-anchor D domain-containing protein [Alphaproteobacteria bacterium]
MRFLLHISALGLFLTVFSAQQTALAQYPGFGDPGSAGAGGTPGGGLTPAVPVVDGGTIPVGATAQVVVRFRNDGSQPVQTGLIRLYPSSNVTSAVALNQCEEEPLAAGAECAIAISVKGLQSGSWRVEMLMSHDGRSRLVTATMSGQVEASGDGADKLTSDIEAIPNEVDFETLSDSQTLVQSVILRNITSIPVDITDIFIDSSEQAGYALKTECEKLEAGQACIATVSWSPQQKGRSSGVLVVRHTGPTALSSVPLKGEYNPAVVLKADVFPQAVPGRGLLVSSQVEIDFGADIQTASTITVSLVNAGDAPLTLNDVQISGSDNGLDYKQEGCMAGTLLQPIEACPLTITWSPTRIGTLYDDVQISHDGARGMLILPIRGVSSTTVSQDQKAIVLADNGDDAMSSGGPSSLLSPDMPPKPGDLMPSMLTSSVVNPASVLDGYKITSFSPSRAIINGPGGSRIVFNNEEIVLGGIAWYVTIQKNGIEFLHKGQRILLLFDRSLSSINRIPASSGSAGASGMSGGSSSSSGSSGSSSSPSSSPAPAESEEDNG